MTIREIEKLTFAQAKSIAIETVKIKEHDCFFVELGEHFGYSVLVFKNGRHIYHANDYELLHSYTVEKNGKEGIWQNYIKSLNKKLFTDSELLEPIGSYEEYNRKDYFLRNLWIMRYDYISAFAITEEDQNAIEEGKKSHPFFNSMSFCYVANKEIIDEESKYFEHLQKEYEKLSNDLDSFREIIATELANHEACLTCDYKEALSAIGLKFDDLPIDKQNIVKVELKKQIDNYQM